MRRADAWRARNGDAICAVELVNGAVFSMALTDHGSARIGVRNHVELRTGRTTVCISDDTHYVAEDDRAIRRRTRVNKMHAFARMYREVSAAIVEGRQLDTAETVLVSAGLALDYLYVQQAACALITAGPQTATGGGPCLGRQCHVVDERLRFIARLRDGEQMARLCAEFGISRKTGYKIRDRYERCGAGGADRSEAAALSASESAAAAARAGDRADQAGLPELGRPEDSGAATPADRRGALPAISTVHAVLDRHGLVTRRRRRRYRAEGTALSWPTQPNDLWCADYKANSCSPIGATATR